MVDIMGLLSHLAPAWYDTMIAQLHYSTIEPLYENTLANSVIVQ